MRGPLEGLLDRFTYIDESQPKIVPGLKGTGDEMNLEVLLIS